MHAVRSTAVLVLGAVLFASPVVLSAQSRESEKYNPRQECLGNPPATPTLRAAMLDPNNWGRRTVEFEVWLDSTSDFLIEEIAKAARHQAAFYRMISDLENMMEDSELEVVGAGTTRVTH